ncbi:MAG: guanylate kinase [Spirochaetia bacterium]|nr:guanylate kinase [Spirochaetota bacterium]MCX8096664.1 guanylate kinase [Spirochaetota bacterium]MDW8112495.1 guanylate kinase [Spirochaetia bacterium]
MEQKVKLGKIFIISAPSGAGKTTILRRILKEVPNLHFSVSVTTRKPREGERDGIDYYFVSVDRVLEMFRNKELLEWAMVHGNFYGTPVWEVENKINAGMNVIVDVDVKGFMKIKRRYPEAISIFIVPPSIEELKNRLLSREGKKEFDENLRKRFEKATYEMSFRELYDYVVVNDDLDRACEELKSIILKNIEKQF